jgi:hypothetical protein
MISATPFSKRMNGEAKRRRDVNGNKVDEATLSESVSVGEQLGQGKQK